MNEEKILTTDIERRITTVDQLLQLHNIDLDTWEVTKELVNTWEGQAKVGEEVIITPLYQVKAWLEPIRIKKDYTKYRQEFIEDLKKLSPKVPKLKQNKKQEERLLEVCLFDHHFGKLAWAEESGDSYDLDIAKKLFKDALEDLVFRAIKYSEIDRIIFPVGNDFFNSDSAHPFPKTTNGTYQQDDSRWQKIFRTGRETIVESINFLSNFAPVDVIIISGNHDEERSFYLGDCLEGWFHNNENVTINNLASPRKYYKFGKNLLGFTHGKYEKKNQLSQIMAEEASDLWGQCINREWHLGHYHHEQVQEQIGCTIRYMSSLSGNDSWHHQRGFISKRVAQAFIWNSNTGLDTQFFYRTT